MARKYNKLMKRAPKNLQRMYTNRKNIIIGDAEPIDLSNRAGIEVLPSSFDSLDKVSKIKVIEKDDAENTENEKIQRQQYSFLTDDIFLSIYDNVWDKLLYSVKNKMNIYYNFPKSLDYRENGITTVF